MLLRMSLRSEIPPVPSNFSDHLSLLRFLQLCVPSTLCPEMLHQSTGEPANYPHTHIVVKNYQRNFCLQGAGEDIVKMSRECPEIVWYRRRSSPGKSKKHENLLGFGFGAVSCNCLDGFVQINLENMKKQKE